MISPQYVDGLELRIKELTNERDAMERRALAFQAGATNLQAERDSLAAYVERLEGIINGSHLTDRTEVMSTLNSAPETSLARLKAQWQAEALESLADLWEADYPCIVDDEGGVSVTIWTGWLRGQAEEIRRQAGGERS